MARWAGRTRERAAGERRSLALVYVLLNVRESLRLERPVRGLLLQILRSAAIARERVRRSKRLTTLSLPEALWPT